MSDGHQEGVTLQPPRHGDSTEPRGGHGRPQVGRQGHPSLQQGEAAASSCSPSLRPHGTFRGVSTATRWPAQRPGLRSGQQRGDPGVQPWRAAWPKAVVLGWLRCLPGCMATDSPHHRAGVSFLMRCLPALGPPQHATALLGHWLLQSARVAAESPAGRAPTPCHPPAHPLPRPGERLEPLWDSSAPARTSPARARLPHRLGGAPQGRGGGCCGGPHCYGSYMC